MRRGFAYSLPGEHAIPLGTGPVGKARHDLLPPMGEERVGVRGSLGSPPVADSVLKGRYDLLAEQANGFHDFGVCHGAELEIEHQLLDADGFELFNELDAVLRVTHAEAPGPLGHDR